MCFVKEAGKLTGKRENNYPLSSKLKEPHYWIETWNEVLRQSVNTRRRGAAANLDYWDGLAGLLVRWPEQGRSRNRVERVISWLEREGALRPGVDVLDIGAGTGDFAIPMAQRGASVTALEPAPAVMAAVSGLVEHFNAFIL
jgi:2-polyprenyl-3-methyl-5-hydroxy-6-metoxy-1,4-benzoquinol methylase